MMSAPSCGDEMSTENFMSSKMLFLQSDISKQKIACDLLFQSKVMTFG